MKLKSILNAWNSPDGIEFGTSQPTNQMTGRLQADVVQHGTNNKTTNVIQGGKWVRDANGKLVRR